VEGGETAMKKTHLGEIMLVTLLLASSLLVGVTSSIDVYDPWCDLDDDGDIDIFDIVRIAGIYGTSGENITKAGLEYDSSWVNITDKCGQYFNITHNLDSTDVIFDITGKESSDSEPHENFYGLTTHMVADPGWNYTLGGGRPFSMVQAPDGGYVIVGDAVPPYPALGYWCVIMMKTDAVGNHLWNHTYGGLEMWADDHGRSVVQTADGGYAIIGSRTQFVDVGDWSHDAWLIKTDATGNQLWNQTYGDQWFEDWGTSVIQTVDGGYMIGGYSSGDVWLVKTDPAGNHLWNQTYGGTSSDFAYSAIQTLDGGYALAGSTTSYSAGFEDFYLVKTDADGVMQWNKTHGGTGHDSAEALVQTLDGGYALAGSTDSFGAGEYDVWLVKTDPAGNHLWNQTYGGTSSDFAYSAIQTLDGGYALAGSTESFGAVWSDVWLVKTDPAGNHLWNQTYGAPNGGKAHSMVQASDGEYVIVGESGSGFYLVKTFDPEMVPMLEMWLAWTASTENTITLYRGEDDPYWNYVRVRVWKIKETP
jgi:hypothetical protein